MHVLKPEVSEVYQLNATEGFLQQFRVRWQQSRTVAGGLLRHYRFWGTAVQLFQRRKGFNLDILHSVPKAL